MKPIILENDTYKFEMYGVHGDAEDAKKAYQAQGINAELCNDPRYGWGIRIEKK